MGEVSRSSRSAPASGRPAPADRDPAVDGRSTRWDEHKAQRKEHILTAAIAAIDTDGSGVGVGRIAAQAELPRSVVYRHFADRSDLDAAIRARILADLTALLAPVFTPTGTVAEAIADAVDTYLDWVVGHPRLHQFLSLGSQTRPATDARALTGTKTALAVRLGEIIAAVLEDRGAPTEPAEPLAFALIGMVDAPVNRWIARPDSGVDLDVLRGLLTRSIWLLLDGNLRALGVRIDPDAPAAELW